MRGGIDLGWAHVSPSVHFTGAVTTFVADDPATWPERFTIAGLTYDRFAEPEGSQLERIWDQATRCTWLRRQAAFDSGSYEQAAKVFGPHGYTREAEQILMTQRRHARQVGRPSSAWPRRAIDRHLCHRRLQVLANRASCGCRPHFSCSSPARWNYLLASPLCAPPMAAAPYTPRPA